MIQTPPLSLYVHFPWCVRKCPYCDFNSHEIMTGIPENDYIAALFRDIEFETPRFHEREVVSVFFGGGTPSLFSPGALQTLLDGIRNRLNLAVGVEITLEANPGATETGHFRGYREAGVNRISIGVQSFNDRELIRLGRIHDSKEAGHAIQEAKAAGFENINIDLMFGLPDQTIGEAMTDLEAAVRHEPTHLSWYQLTIEPNTFFYKHPPLLPEDQALWDMQQQGQALLAEHGYRQYEISAYSKPGFQCRHNLNYWQFGDYVGIGAGAHSKVTDTRSGVIRRCNRHRIPQTYMDKAGSEASVTQRQELHRDEIILEFMMNALRLCDGFDPSLIAQHAGIPVDAVREQLDNAVEQGWIEWSMINIKPTKRGMQYLNNVLALF